MVVFVCLCMIYFPVFMCLGLSSLLLGRPDEMFAADFGAMHSLPDAGRRRV